MTSQIGLAGLAVMGQVRVCDLASALDGPLAKGSCFRVTRLSVLLQNLALNVAEKGFRISVFNRTYEKTEMCEKRAKKEGALCACTDGQRVWRRLSCSKRYCTACAAVRFCWSLPNQESVCRADHSGHWWLCRP